MSSSDVSAVTNYFSTAAEGFTTTLGSTISASATSVGLNSTTGLTNGTIFVGIIEPGQTGQQTFTGTVDISGSQITNVKWVRGNNVGHAGGVTIVDYVSGAAKNMTTAGILKQHSQAGAHVGITNTGGLTTDTAHVTGAETVDGALTVTGAATLNGGTVLPAGDIIFTELLATIFSGQVQSQSNAGSAGGTIKYINLGGIKMAWGTTSNQTSSSGGTDFNVTLPVGFFTTIQTVTTTAVSATIDVRQDVPVASFSTSTISIAYCLVAPASSGTVAAAWFVIGT